ncbi:MarR family winged helix-turn-helix transcriptional regulator [Saccharopolyspora elongata]|uniref:MarR family transcriptional regulator n=1 Tax=Saccharopolyspora elongata TaxID=2530387 RepID=A0A4R4Z1B0_9PSEU|nr:MarR family transcriptional regulator [Saccharopolyspora elongata]TDD51721.1 MarR family transcriptional regulator [Saccharopolyspora elongata]
MGEVDSRAVADELTTVISTLRRVVRRSLRAELPMPDLRGAQVELLQVVEQQPGVSVAGAALRLRMAANSASTLVNQLTRVGLLRRETDPGDRRAVRLHLTDAATHRVAAWRQARTRLVGDALAELSAADQKAVADALRGLRALVLALEGGGVDDRGGGAVPGPAAVVRRAGRGRRG